MGDRANYAVVDGDGRWRLYYSHWGAVRMDSDLVAGPDAATRFAGLQRRVEDTVGGWLDDVWCEGAALIDHQQRVLLFFTWHLDDVAHQAALFAVLARTWPGWEVRWAHGGIGDIVAHLGLDRAIVRAAREPSRFSAAGPDFIDCLVTVRDEAGHIEGYALSQDNLAAPWRGPDLVAALPAEARITTCLDHPRSGVHIDRATRSLGLWSATEILGGTLDELAERWPGWRVEFWADRWQEQLDRCRDAIVVPPLDLRSGLDTLDDRLARAWTGDPGTDWRTVVDALRADGREVTVSPDVSAHVQVPPGVAELAAVAEVVAELRKPRS